MNSERYRDRYNTQDTGYIDTEINTEVTEKQIYRDTETQRHRDTETQRQIQRYRYTETQRHRDTETP